MIISNTLCCARCGKLLHEAHEHLVFRGKSFCSLDCIYDEIDNEIEQGDVVVSEQEYKDYCKIKQKEW